MSGQGHGRFRIDLWEIDTIRNYKYYFPSYNFDHIAVKYNNNPGKTLTFVDE